MNCYAKAGFSLLEVMVALSISLIIASISLYGMKHYLDNAYSTSDQQQLLNAIQVAKNEALVRSNKIILCGSLDELQCSNIWENHLLVLEQDQVLMHFNLSGRGKIHSRFFPLGKQNLEFKSNGWLNAENGSFWFCFADSTNPNWAIVLNKSGRARVVNPDRTGVILDPEGKRLHC